MPGFYLYDTSSDKTVEALGPLVKAGIVKLHQFTQDQAGSFQVSSLQHCSNAYAHQEEWLIDCDVDEFIIPTSILARRAVTLDRPLVDQIPLHPLAELLRRNSLYQQVFLL